jgi:CheY-like chemotaxis protein
MMALPLTDRELSLKGFRILLVEDEVLVALALEDMLIEMGCEVVGPAHSVSEALKLVDSLEIDGAILDVNLGGQRVYPVADVLAARHIPFVFVTGYGSAGLRDLDRNRPVLQKPYRANLLAEIICRWR